MKLKHPIKQTETKTVTEINFPRDPVARHFIGVAVPDVAKLDTGAVLQVVSNMSGEPLAVLEKLHFDDLLSVQTELMLFLGFTVPPNGGDPSSAESQNDS